jgi:hypothetical protein
VAHPGRCMRSCISAITDPKTCVVTASSQVFPVYLSHRFWYRYLVSGKSHYIYPAQQDSDAEPYVLKGIG